MIMSIARAAGLCSVLSILTMAPTVTAAEVDLVEADACLAQKLELGQNPAQCVNDALFACTQETSERHNVASLCFVEAQKGWDEGIAAQMTELRATSDEDIVVLAGIELKYDLLIARAQCDRLNELRMVSGEGNAEVIQRQSAQCYATAAGLAYLRLKIRASATAQH